MWVAGGWVHGKLWEGLDCRQTERTFEGGGESFRSILFSDPQHGWAVGDRLAIFTQDGGATWQPMDVPDGYWKALRFTPEQNAVLAGTSSGGGIQVAHSSDGGMTWSLAAAAGSPTTSELSVDLHFADPWFGWAVVTSKSYREPFPSSLLITGDGGQSWERHDVLGGGVYQIEFVDRLRGWAIGQGGLVARSEDGGRSWDIQSIPIADDLHALSFLDHDHGWVLSVIKESYSTSSICWGFPDAELSLWRTLSGGQEWEDPVCIEVPRGTVSSVLPYRSPHRMQFVDQEVGWITGLNGLILKTEDGGLSWQSQISGVAVDLTDVFFLDQQTGWVTGDEGVLLHTIDGGVHWRQLRVGTRKLTGVHFVDSVTGWVTSHDSDVFQTSDGGQAWEPIGFDEHDSRYSSTLEAVDEHHVWVGMTNGIRAYAPVCLALPEP